MAKVPLANWPRPHFAPSGGDALLLYRVYGTVDTTLPLSAGTYRVGGLPSELQMAVYTPTEHPDAFFELLDGPIWGVVGTENPDLAEQVRGAANCVAMLGGFSDPPSLDYFRDTVGIVTWLLDSGGIAVYDPLMIKLWTADEWKAVAFAPSGPEPHRHVVILTSPEPDGALWFHTRGLRKFGRPDLSVRGVGPAHRHGVTALMNRFIELQALGGIVPDGQAVRTAALPPGGVCRHAGDLDDPDFNNVHIEVVWPAGALS